MAEADGWMLGDGGSYVNRAFECTAVVTKGESGVASVGCCG